MRETCAVEGNKNPNQKGTSMVKRNRRRPSVKITGGGTGVVNHAGNRLLADLAGLYKGLREGSVHHESGIAR